MIEDQGQEKELVRLMRQFIRYPSRLNRDALEQAITAYQNAYFEKLKEEFDGR